MLVRDFGELVQLCDKFKLQDENIWEILGTNYIKLLNQREYNEISDMGQSDRLCQTLAKTFNHIQKNLHAFGMNTDYLKEITRECLQEMIGKAYSARMMCLLMCQVGNLLEDKALSLELISNSIPKLDKGLKKLDVTQLVQLLYLAHKKSISLQPNFFLKLVKYFLKQVQPNDISHLAIFSYAVSNMQEHEDAIAVYKQFFLKLPHDAHLQKLNELPELVMYGQAIRNFNLPLPAHFYEKCERIAQSQTSPLQFRALVIPLTLGLST